MSERLSTVEIHTRRGDGRLTISNFLNPDIIYSHNVSLNLVEAMVLPDGSAVENPNHSTKAQKINLQQETITESITLPETKAERLVRFFENLRPYHPFECHDLVMTLEGWETDIGPKQAKKFVQPAKHISDPEDSIIAGSPYTVWISSDGLSEQDSLRTHSCIGTDDDRLLGLLGKGHAFATMDPGTVMTLYDRGASRSLLARTLPPKLETAM